MDHHTASLDTPALPAESDSRLRRGLRRIGKEAATTLSSIAQEEIGRRRSRYGHDLRGAANTLRQVAPKANTPSTTGLGLSRLPSKAADTLDHLSHRVEHQSLTELGRSVAATGRAHPLAFVAGCVLGGLALGRVLMASTPSSDTQGTPSPHKPATPAPQSFKTGDTDARP